MIIRSRVSWPLMLLILVGCAGGLDDLLPGTPTTVEHPEGAVSFLVLGDWGRRGDYYQDDVAEQMADVAERTDAAFVVTTGDNFYPSGVDGVSDSHWRASYEDVYSADALQVPWYPTLGNHDWRGDVEAQIAYSEESDRWDMPARYYTRRIPLGDGHHMRLVLLDTNSLVRLRLEDVPEGRPWAVSEQLRWADRVLSESDARWAVVVGHHPMHSGGSRHGPSPALRRILEPMLEAHDVDVYLAGHEHHLEHLAGTGATHHFISGGGSRLRSYHGGPRSVWGTSRPGFLLVSVTPGEMVAQFVDHLGNVLHRAELEGAEGGRCRESCASAD